MCLNNSSSHTAKSAVFVQPYSHTLAYKQGCQSGDTIG